MRFKIASVQESRDSGVTSVTINVLAYVSHTINVLGYLTSGTLTYTERQYSLLRIQTTEHTSSINFLLIHLWRNRTAPLSFFNQTFREGSYCYSITTGI